MIKQMFTCSLVILLLLTGCGGQATTQPAADSQGEADLTVFRSPT